ncbi:PEP-CTERM sorting domain-containing protein [Desulfosarcina ovata]|nr:PEP-CTERM sorting domain-containing protein [Desulfosarcina ovata]
MKKVLLFTLIVSISMFTTAAWAGPYAPAAGEEGSTAIHMDDEAFVAWATGYEDYIIGDNVSSTWQTPEKALGKAVGSSYDIVCLGAGGSIVLTFDTAIYDGDGYDFAVFENSFNSTFLELAYVEVSSDGVNYFRFDNDSQTASAVGGFGAVDPTNIDGLAGKYKQGYGTPFDLADLSYDAELLDIDNITYIRIVDIIGDGTYLDSDGDVIYDPYPTSGSAGFDLDAIGVINAVPVPAAIWLLGSGLLGIIGIRKRKYS